jgi:hypothetical protein
MTPAGQYFAQAVRMARPQAPWWLRLTGYSMAPALVENDELLVEPRIGMPRLGEVIVFPHNGRLVAHRVIGVAKPLRTAGDASRGQIERVPYEEVLGTVISARRDGRTIAAPVYSPLRAIGLRVRIALLYYARINR